VTGRRLAVPPGRAGRLRLERRLQVARRGADLLDRKLRILQRELPGLRADAARAARDWEQCAADADRWLLRAALLGGQRAIRLGGDDAPAELDVGYAVTVGVRHPAACTCTFPPAAGLGRSRRDRGQARAPGRARGGRPVGRGGDGAADHGSRGGGDPAAAAGGQGPVDSAPGTGQSRRDARH